MSPHEVRLDTHVVVWLFTGEVERLSPAAVEAIENHRLLISPMVQLELTFLHEIDRLRVSGSEVVDDLSRRVHLDASSVSLGAAVAAATPVDWTRDPFDRLIVGDALAAGTSLITCDSTIRRNLDLALW